MKANGSQCNYDYSEKNLWRRWLWNRISERVGKGKNSSATILYLCGPDHLDRKWALHKGFTEKNLIGIDQDMSNIDHLRRSGGIGICESLESVIFNWSAKKPIDVIIADFCCGLQAHVIDRFIFSIILSEGVHDNTIIVVNLMRGRDGITNDLFKNFNLRITLKGIHKTPRKYLTKLWGNIDIHRGARFLAFYSNIYDCCFTEFMPIEMKPLHDIIKFYEQLNPSYYSYKSNRGNLVFDSVIFKRSGQFNCVKSCLSSFEESDEKVKRKISAAKALQTMVCS